eukprot:403371606
MQSNKRQLMLEYYQNYKISVTRKQFYSHSDKQLELILRDKLNTLRMSESAKFIQNYWRLYIKRKQFKRIHTQKEKACKRIQKFWKKIRIFSLLPRALQYRKDFAAIRIQKYINGFKSRKKVSEELKLQRLLKNFDYFEQMREKIRIEAAIQVQAVWKMHQAMKEKIFLKMQKLKIEQASKQANRKNKQQSSKNTNVLQINQVQNSKNDKKTGNMGTNKKMTSAMSSNKGYSLYQSTSSRNRESQMNQDKSVENDSNKMSQRDLKKSSQMKVNSKEQSNQQESIKQHQTQISPKYPMSKITLPFKDEFNKSSRINSNISFYDGNRMESQGNDDQTPSHRQRSYMVHMSSNQDANKEDEQRSAEYLDYMILGESPDKDKRFAQDSKDQFKVLNLDKINEESMSPSQSARAKRQQFNKVSDRSKSYAQSSHSNGDFFDDQSNEQPPSQQHIVYARPEKSKFQSTLAQKIQRSIQQKLLKEMINQNMNSARSNNSKEYLNLNNEQSRINPSRLNFFNNQKQNNIKNFTKTPAIRSDRRILDRQLFIGATPNSSQNKSDNLQFKRQEPKTSTSNQTYNNNMLTSNGFSKQTQIANGFTSNMSLLSPVNFKVLNNSGDKKQSVQSSNMLSVAKNSEGGGALAVGKRFQSFNIGSFNSSSQVSPKKKNSLTKITASKLKLSKFEDGQSFGPKNNVNNKIKKDKDPSHLSPKNNNIQDQEDSDEGTENDNNSLNDQEILNAMIDTQKALNHALTSPRDETKHLNQNQEPLSGASVFKSVTKYVDDISSNSHLLNPNDEFLSPRGMDTSQNNNEQVITSNDDGDYQEQDFPSIPRKTITINTSQSNQKL